MTILTVLVLTLCIVMEDLSFRIGKLERISSRDQAIHAYEFIDRLAEQLHNRIETVSLNDLPRIMHSLRTYGGYFRRFKIPNSLNDLVDEDMKPKVDPDDLTLEQRLTLAFLQADAECLDLLRDDGPEGYHEGSTGSIAIIEPQDQKPFWESQAYDIIIGHVGDTRYVHVIFDPCATILIDVCLGYCYAMHPQVK